MLRSQSFSTTIVLMLLVSTAVAWSQEAPASGFPSFDELTALLPAATGQVSVMTLASPPRLLELTARIQAAARQDPAWFQAQVRAAGPGQPMAYDPRLGVSEEEYKEYQALGQSIGLAKQADGKVTVTRKADGAPAP